MCGIKEEQEKGNIKDDVNSVHRCSSKLKEMFGADRQTREDRLIVHKQINSRIK